MVDVGGIDIEEKMPIHVRRNQDKGDTKQNMKPVVFPVEMQVIAIQFVIDKFDPGYGIAGVGKIQIRIEQKVDFTCAGKEFSIDQEGAHFRKTAGQDQPQHDAEEAHLIFPVPQHPVPVEKQDQNEQDTNHIGNDNGQNIS